MNDNLPNFPDNQNEVLPVTKRKIELLLENADFKLTGFLLTDEVTGKTAIVDKGAVLWVNREEWWWLFHEVNRHPKKDQLSDEHYLQVQRLKEGYEGNCYACEPVGILNQKLSEKLQKYDAILKSLFKEEGVTCGEVAEARKEYESLQKE
jgi:hypothetical protein